MLMRVESLIVFPIDRPAAHLAAGSRECALISLLRFLPGFIGRSSRRPNMETMLRFCRGARLQDFVAISCPERRDSSRAGQVFLGSAENTGCGAR
jgi:hypothetical protein